MISFFNNYWRKRYVRVFNLAKSQAKWYRARINALKIDKDCLELELNSANETIHELAETKANLQDTLTVYKQHFGELPENYTKSQEAL
jgi:hypothetical protein